MAYSQIKLIRKIIKHRRIIFEIPTLWRMLKAWKNKTYKIPVQNIILPLLGLAYIISPLDFIPNITLPFIGLIDDFIVLSLIINRLLNEIDRFLLWEKEINKI